MAREKIINPFFPLKVEDVQAMESRQLVPRKAIYNAETGSLVSVVSDRYRIVQNDVLVNRFEEYLNETDVKFVRTGAGCNSTGSSFWANYTFPEIATDVGEYKTQFGTMNDKIKLAVDVWNSYNGTSNFGMGVGGIRVVCVNGMIAKEKIYRIGQNHVSEEIDLINEFVLNFETAKNIFINDLAKSWEELTNMDFDKVRAATVLRAMDLSVTYANMIGRYYKKQLNDKHLKTMWDFYNMITWFTTHVMEQRSRTRAMQASLAASQQLIGGSF